MTLPTDFPSDEDVEIAYQSLYESSDRFTPAPWKVERALQAIADTRRTHEYCERDCLDGCISTDPPTEEE